MEKTYKNILMRVEGNKAWTKENVMYTLSDEVDQSQLEDDMNFFDYIKTSGNGDRVIVEVKNANK